MIKVFPRDYKRVLQEIEAEEKRKAAEQEAKDKENAAAAAAEEQRRNNNTLQVCYVFLLIYHALPF